MNLTTISFTPVATYFFPASSNLTLSKIFRLLYRTIVLPTTQQYPCWLQHYERQICQNTTKSQWKIFSTRLLIPKEIWLLFWWSSPRYLVSVPLIIYLILFNIWMNTERSCSGFHDQRWSILPSFGDQSYRQNNEDDQSYSLGSDCPDIFWAVDSFSHK